MEVIGQPLEEVGPWGLGKVGIEGIEGTAEWGQEDWRTAMQWVEEQQQTLQAMHSIHLVD